MLVASALCSSPAPVRGPAPDPQPPRFDASGAATLQQRLATLPEVKRLFESGQYDLAAAAFESLVAALPDRSQSATAAALLGLGDPADVSRLRARLLDGLGLCHLRSRRFQRALDSLDRAAAADREAASPRVHRGLVLMHQKRYDEAARAFEEGIARGAGGAKVLLDLGRVLARSGELARARVVLAQCLEDARQRGDVQAWGTGLEASKLLAEIAVEQDRLEEAEERLRSVLAMAPGEVQSRYRLGRLLVRRGRAADAERHLEIFRRDSETLASIHAVLGEGRNKTSGVRWVADAYRRLGLLHLAEVHYRQILAGTPGDPQALRAIQDLDHRLLRVAERRRGGARPTQPVRAAHARNAQEAVRR
jgi:tetratricopeptide (TPR) repeat protein